MSMESPYAILFAYVALNLWVCYKYPTNNWLQTFFIVSFCWLAVIVEDITPPISPIQDEIGVCLMAFVIIFNMFFIGESYQKRKREKK